MSSWYLIQAKPRQALRAKEHLDNQQIENYLPTIDLEKVIRGKRQTVTEPLFSNYLFVKLDINSIGWSSIRSTRGVRDFVRFGGEIAKVPASLIDELRGRNDSDLLIETNAPQKGDEVTLLEGAFKDLDGIYQVKNGDERSIILLTLLNKTIELDVLNKNLRKKQ